MRLLLAGVAACALSVPTQAADYYFSAVGSDATGNGSQAQPWRSVTRFNALDLNPGDGVYFRAGDTFDGRLALDELDSGVNSNGQLVAPVLIGSYDATDPTHRAIIRSPAGSEALLANNAGGIELRDLEFVSGSVGGGTRRSGVKFTTDMAATATLQKLHHLRVENVVSHGFAYAGVEVRAEGGVGFADVDIVGSDFYANAYGGVSVSAAEWQQLIHTNVTIDNVQTHGNPGFAGCSPHCGHGAVIGQVDGAVIQNSAAYSNGVTNGAGNVGLWAWQSNAVTIQNNLAYGNRSPSGGDGGAFDLDGGVTNSIVQYNQSYDNDGAGLLLAQFQFADPMSQNVFRYNLSVNDGRDQYGGITIWGASTNDLAQSAVFHNNTVVVDRSVAPNARGPVWFLGQQHDDVALINNAFIALDGASLVSGTTTASQASFVGNAYWTDGAPLSFEGTTYASVLAWANAENQERIAGQFAATTGDPEVTADGAYRPRGYSPLVNAARSPGSEPWPAWLTSLGAQDLRGVALGLADQPDIGAYEIPPADFDGDGAVNASDLALWQSAFGAGSPASLAIDWDGDADADGAEFLLWQRRLGVTSAAAAGQRVPEPHSGVAMLLTVLFGPVRRRMRPPARWLRVRRRVKMRQSSSKNLQGVASSCRLSIDRRCVCNSGSARCWPRQRFARSHWRG